MTESVLMIDDDGALCELLTVFLADEGFNVTVCHSGEAGLERALEESFSIIILDIMLPGINGLEVLRRLRKHSEVPVLMLTARGEEVDRIIGLEIGADDYLPKPFNPRELTARLRSILRRTQVPRREAREAVYRFGRDFILNLTRHHLSGNGEEIHLTAMEFSLLEALVRAGGGVVSREDLCVKILGREYSPLDRSIDVHVSNLRKKLGRNAGEPAPIKSVRGEGYHLLGAVEDC